MSLRTSVMDGTEVARESFSLFLSVAFKLLDCNDSANDSFLIGVSLPVPLKAGRGGGGGGGGRKPIGGGGGGGGHENGGGGGGGGIGVTGMLP